MDAVAPGVAESLYLLWLAGDVLAVAVAHVAAGGGPLEVGVEPDAVGRVDVDALHFALQALPLGEGGHHLQAVAQDHTVLPVTLVLVELGAVGPLRQPVEVGEHINLVFLRFPVLLGLAQQVGDERLGMDFFLDVEGRDVDHQVVQVLLVLAPPDQLGVQIAVAPLVGHAQR